MEVGSHTSSELVAVAVVYVSIRKDAGLVAAPVHKEE
jgi:hypothetical protein